MIRKGSEIARLPAEVHRNHAAIGPQPRFITIGLSVTRKECKMKAGLIRIATNERLTRAAHWTVFGIGALSLTFSIAATAASAL